MKTIQNLIWDFNGTLLDDLELCLTSINGLLDKRNLTPLNIQRYHEIFTFPIRDYYTAAGFDFEKESYEVVAVEFIDSFLAGLKETHLHKDAVASLEFFREKGFRQIILSAMQQHELRRTAESHNIQGYFEDIFGINDHYAHGKADLALQAMQQCGFVPEHTCIIGDTLHDAEVAKQLGTECILVAEGHQSAVRLATSGFRVINSLKEITGCF